MIDFLLKWTKAQQTMRMGEWATISSIQERKHMTIASNSKSSNISDSSGRSSSNAVNGGVVQTSKNHILLFAFWMGSIKWY